MTFLFNDAPTPEIYTLVAILIATGIGLSYRSLDGLEYASQSLERVYRHRVEPLQALKVVADKYAVDIVDATHKARNGNLSWKDARASIDDANDVINQRWQAYIGSPLSGRERQLVEEAGPLLDSANSAVEKLQVILRSGDEEHLVKFTRHALYQAIDPISGKFAELIEAQTTLAREEIAHSSAMFAARRDQSHWMMALIAGTGFLLAFVIIRSLQQRLGATPQVATDIANRIAADDLDFELDTTNAASGSLLAALGRMKASLLTLRLRYKGQLDAIHRNQAVAEFTPAGELITANENFLRLFGCALDEIRGKDHSLLCPEDFRHSANYGRFWESLASGTSHNG